MFVLPECFDFLKKQLPSQADEKKTSNLSILHSALRFIQTLKRKERELEHEMERLAREKITAQQKLATLKKEMTAQCDGIDFGTLLPDVTDIKVESIADMDVEVEEEVRMEPAGTPVERLPLPSVVKVTTHTNGIKEVNFRQFFVYIG